MGSPPDDTTPRPLIATAFGDAVSGGGLFSVDGSRAARIDAISSMGLASDGRRLARVLRCLPQDALLTELVVYDRHGVRQYLRLDDAVAAHDVRWDGDLLVVTSPWYNAVRWFSTAGDLVREVRYPGPADAWHLNCVAERDGVWYATLFGDFGAARGWNQPGRRASGRLVELATGRTVAGGLSSPHSPRWIDGTWVVCNSDEQELVAVDERSGRVVRRVACGGWTRGIAHDDDFLYVGACPRRASHETADCAEIVVVDRRRWNVVDAVAVPAQEIYEVAFVPQPLLDGVRRGFDVNPRRTSEFRQHRIIAELGVETPRTLWPTGEPLPWDDFRCTVACSVPDRCDAGDLIAVPVRVTNRSASFFTSSPPSPVYASYKWLDAQTGAYLSDARAHRSPLPRTLFPGETLEMTMHVVVPERAGAAILRITLMQEGVSWFDDQDPHSGAEFFLELLEPERAPSRAPIAT
jgi:acetolactate synthase I/II/III large subunit